MKWQEVAPDDIPKLRFASKHADNASKYAEMIVAIKAGKTIKVDLEPDTTPKAMSQRIYTAAKSAGIQVFVRTLVGKQSLVVWRRTALEKAGAEEGEEQKR